MYKLILNIVLFFLLFSCSSGQKNQEKILFVASNQHTYGNTNINASNHFSEIVLAYDIFVKNGYIVDFVSPKGGAIPIGYITTSDSIQKKYLYDNHFMNLLKYTKSSQEIKASEYKAIYYSGGGSAMFGVAENENIQNIATEIYKNNGVVSAICHGTAGIVHLKDEQGESLYLNKKISGYPDLFENKESEYYKTFPFSIDETINENKGSFIYSDKQRDNFFVVDGRFITGQDPSASVSVAQNVIKIIKNNH